MTDEQMLILLIQELRALCLVADALGTTTLPVAAIREIAYRTSDAAEVVRLGERRNER